MNYQKRRAAAAALLLAAALPVLTTIASPATSFAAADSNVPAVDTRAEIAKAQAVIDKAIDYLKSQQKPDGGWQKDDKQPPAVTAIVLNAIVHGRPADKQADYVKKGYEKLLSYQVGDGGIYKDLQANYNTCIATSALIAADNPAYKPQIDKAIAYLRSLQLTDLIRPEFVNDKEQFTGKQVVKDDKDPFFGGWGYGGARAPARGDRTSNTQMALDALHDAGLKPDDPAFQNALKFVTRLQNRSESNDQKWATNDGGFIYTPGDQRTGDSVAGSYKDDAGVTRFRSYGSMTYAGIKSMIYAGLTRDDPRVAAALDWVKKNWTLDENPGMKAGNPDAAQAGLYYYFNTFAKALDANDQPVIVDAQGKAHDWRVELIDKVASLQKPDGSFVGGNRFMEDIPVLATSHCVASLSEAIKDLKEHAGK